MKNIKKNLFNRGLIMRKSINVMLVASMLIAMFIGCATISTKGAESDKQVFSVLIPAVSLKADELSKELEASGQDVEQYSTQQQRQRGIKSVSGFILSPLDYAALLTLATEHYSSNGCIVNQKNFDGRLHIETSPPNYIVWIGC